MLLSPFDSRKRLHSVQYALLWGLFSSILHLHYVYQRRKCSRNPSPDHVKLAGEKMYSRTQSVRLDISLIYTAQFIVGCSWAAEIR
jgi:hypothetical protein